MNRRGFLKAMLAAAAAPAIVRAESLMKIYVPPEPKLFVPSDSIVQGMEFGKNDFTFETWVKKPETEGMILGGDGEWKHIAQVYSGGRLHEYVNGVKVATGTLKRTFDMAVHMPRQTDNYPSTKIDFAGGSISDLRITNGIARSIEPPALPKKTSWFDVTLPRRDNAKFPYG